MMISFDLNFRLHGCYAVLDGGNLSDALGAKYLVFSPYNYIFDIIVSFIIQKLKSEHTSLKEYTNWAKLTKQN